MTTDLPPDVRIKAAEALELARRTYDNVTLSPNESARALAMVDAVTAVVAEEIARALELNDSAQARVELLTAALDTAIEALGWASDYVAVPWPKVYQVEPLRAALAAGATESCTCDSDGCAYGDGDCPVCQRLEGTGQRCPHDESEGK